MGNTLGMFDSFLQYIQPLLQTNIFDIRLQTYLLVIASVVLTFVIIRLIRVVALSRFEAMAKKTQTSIDDTFIQQIESVGFLFYFVLSVYIPLFYIQSTENSLPDLFFRTVTTITVLVLSFYIAQIAAAFVSHTIGKIIEKRTGKVTEADESVLALLSLGLKGVVWLIAIIAIFNIFAVDLTGLVAGLGVGGLVVAFAIQNVLADLFSSLSIYIDKPFKPGDFIIVGNMMGTVKKVGIKSTRIASLDGEEIVMSNRQLTDAEIHNYDRMRRRRVAFKIRFPYNTNPKKLAKIPSIIQAIIQSQEKATFDRCHVFEFDSSSINAEIVYYIQSGDYTIFMDTQQAIVLALVGIFAEQKIEFAFPTQTIHLVK